MGIRTRVPRDAPVTPKRAERPRFAFSSFTTKVVAAFGVVLLALIVAAAGAAPALAQAPLNSLQSITPENGQSLPVSPTEVVLSFNQELDDGDFAVVIVTCNGQLANTLLPEIEPDRLVVRARFAAELPSGNCVIDWHLSNDIGEVIIDGRTTFGVTGDPSATTTTVEGATTDATTTATTDPLIRANAIDTPVANVAAEEGSSGGAIWLGRLLSTIGIMIMFGSLALISIGWPEGPEYIVTVRFLRTVWGVALLGSVIYVMALAADFDGTSFASAMSPTSWLDLTDAGWAGRGALLRLVFVALAAPVAFRPERIIDPTSTMWAWALPGFAAVSVAMSRVSDPVAIVGLVVGVAHVLAASIWFGGAALVSRVILAGPGDDDLVQASRTFSRISLPAILITCVTGVIQIVRLDGNALFTSGHGQVVLLKVIAVAAMLAVAMAVRQQVTMRLDRARELTAPLADRFRRAFGAEVTVGIVVLAFSGWLLALTPATADPLAGESFGPAIDLTDAGSGVRVKVSFGPAVVGRNGIKVEVLEPAEGITNLTLRFIPPAGTTGDSRFVIEQPIPVTGAGTAWLDDNIGLPFGVSGTWTMQVLSSSTLGAGQSPAATFLILNSDGTVDSVVTNDTTPAPGINLIDTSTTLAPLATDPVITLDPNASTTTVAGT
ncbi:MAG TPA: CopD family protein [Ilumatobacter sp.]|nr:CopD family protein [Ilumatobacter sp.]